MKNNAFFNKWVVIGGIFVSILYLFFAADWIDTLLIRVRVVEFNTISKDRMIELAKAYNNRYLGRLDYFESLRLASFYMIRFFCSIGMIIIPLHRYRNN